MSYKIIYLFIVVLFLCSCNKTFKIDVTSQNILIQPDSIQLLIKGFDLQDAMVEDLHNRYKIINDTNDTLYISIKETVNDENQCDFVLDYINSYIIDTSLLYLRVDKNYFEDSGGRTYVQRLLSQDSMSYTLHIMKRWIFENRDIEIYRIHKLLKNNENYYELKKRIIPIGVDFLESEISKVH